MQSLQLLSLRSPIKSKESASNASTAAGKPGKASKKEDNYAPPSRDAWRHMRNQLISLEKAKTASGLVQAWKGEKTQPQKRRSYYDVLLLNPNVTKQEVHKQSWQKQTSLQRHVHGWMRKWELVNVEGADPSMPNFEELCAAACKGLPERLHELRAWGHKASCSMSTARDCNRKQPLKMARL